MRRFFFHFDNGLELSTDDAGLELADAEHAYMEAIAGARAMWPELLTARTNPLDCAFEVTDAKGALLFRLPFSELVEACNPRRAKHSSELALHKELMRTRARADSAIMELRNGFVEARNALGEASRLIRQLDRAERRSRPT